MKKDLTQGSVTKTMLLFAGPMIVGNLLQQCYNIADTLIVGRVLGAEALASVGAAYTLLTFLTSILIGLCMGSGSVFSWHFGGKNLEQLRESVGVAFALIGGITIAMNLTVFLLLDPILSLLSVPDEIYGMMRGYVHVLFIGLIFVFLYNFFAFLLRALGNSVIPLCFLGVASVLNILLDLAFVIGFRWGVQGAAAATVLAQAVSGIGLGIYTWMREPGIRPKWKSSIGLGISRNTVGAILRFSLAACIQQSVMNFGILMIQGLVNHFGTVVMAAFATAVKIDSFAYMPAQEFGNAFSLFISQNHGAGDEKRVKQGVKSAIRLSVGFCLMISALVFAAAPQLMRIFIEATEVEIIDIGTGYLRIEGAFYWGIGLLFLLYGYYQGVGRPEMSLVLTVVSLGTRVLLAYLLAPISSIGVMGIWSAIPIGWVLADAVGILCMGKMTRKLK